MNKIWAPWRIRYIHKPITKSCIFCLSSKSNLTDKKKFVIIREKLSFSILNTYPYNNGHFMVCPFRHIKNTDELNQEEAIDILNVLNQTKRLINKALKPAGYNIGINIGRVSGAGVDQHIHIHVVPRWNGDTNFMPVIHDTKIISQSLNDLYNKLIDVYERTNRKNRK